MKVIFIDNSLSSNDCRLTLGKEYIVLSIEIGYNPNIQPKFMGNIVKYRIVDDDDMVIPFESNIFEISDGNLSKLWIAYSSIESSIEFVPESWAYRYFWDDYYNDETEALRLFEEEKNKIYQEFATK